MKDWLSPNDPTYWDECADCGHYRSEHADPPDPVCGCDVLSLGEWHVCPCPEFVPADVVTASRTDRQPPASSAVTKGGLVPVAPDETKHPDLVTHHEET